MSEQDKQAVVAVGARLRECREAKGWALVEAAERLSEATGVPLAHQLWVLWEQGLRVPEPEEAAALSALFGAAPGWFTEAAH